MSSFLGRIILGFRCSLEPIQISFENEANFRDFLADLGWDVSVNAAQLATVRSAFALDGLFASAKSIHDALESGGAEDLSLIDDLIEAVSNLIQAIRQMADSPPAGLPPPLNTPEFWNDVPGQLIDFAFLRSLERQQPFIFGALLTFGVISQQQLVLTGANRLPYERVTVHWGRLREIVKDPVKYLGDVYRWEGPDPFAHAQLLHALRQMFSGMHLAARIGSPDASLLSRYFNPANPVLTEIGQLSIPIIREASADWQDYAELGLRLLPIPDSGNPDGLPVGFVITPLVTGTLSQGGLANAEFLLSVEGGFESDEAFRLEVRPSGVSVSVDPNVGTIDARVTISGQPDRPWIPIGSPGNHRIEVGGLLGEMAIHGAVANPEFLLKLSTGAEPNPPKISAVIQFSDGDSFLKQIIGDGEQRFEFPASLSWSSKNGLAVNNSGGLTVSMPVHRSLGPAQIQDILLRLEASTEDVDLMVGANILIHLGPLIATVEEAGLRFALIPVPDGRPRGILGDLDLALGFNPPTGLGLTIEGNGFTGGGFMRYVEADQHYEGALELEYEEKITLKAIGLLTTRLPDGKAGFSLLIIITSEFTPVQLGLGFTLNGVGGLLGLNRTANAERLRSGLREGTLNSVLFPENVIANASRILSDLEQVFPAEPGRFIFGPMARIGWGTPTLLTADLGLLIEIPDPVRVLILGVVKATLPDEKARLLELQVNFLGVIDFEAEWFSFDASLYNSKLLTYPLTGDMAMRLSWGAEPNFLLTVGGFHPAYNPPPLNLPTLRRLSMHLTSGNNPRITLDTYFAITSNTVQFGAKAELYAEAAGFNVYGYLSFDVLFQFNPFYFIASISAKLALRSGSSEIASIGLDFTLEGPTPWHAKGTAKLKICWFLTIKVRFDKTFGEERNTRLDDIPVLPLLQAALSDQGNWEAQPPGGRRMLVSFKQIQADGDQVVVYPFGILTIQQKVVPLKIPIQRFGSQRPADGDCFAIEAVLADPAGDTETLGISDVDEMFAPGQFFEMSDAQKLASKSFERYDSGVKLVDSESFEGDYAVRREVAYELFYVDEQRDVLRQPEPHRPDLAAFEHWATSGTIADSPLSHARTGKSALAPEAVTLAQEAHVVVNASDLRQVAEDTLANSEAGARGVMEELIRANPALEGEILVVPVFEVNRS